MKPPRLSQSTEEPSVPAETSRVVFLLGAGASVPADVPHTKALVERIEKDCPADLATALSQVLNHLKAWVKRQPDRALDIELVYETVVRLEKPLKDALLFGTENAERFCDASTARELREFIETTIRRSMYAKAQSLEYLAPLRTIVQRDGAIDVYSTNYDTCIELLAEHLRLVWADGFSVRWDPDVFDRDNVQVRIRKLHGSVLWFEDETQRPFRSMIGGAKTAAELTEWFGGTCRQFLLYPARKSGYDAPYIDNLTALARALGSNDESVVLVVIGYSFRDEALLKVVSDAARRNRLLTVVLVDPDAEAIYRDRLHCVAGDLSVPSPLRDRVVPYGLGLDKPGAVTRRLVDEIERAAADAHRRERTLVESDVSDEYSWFGVAQTWLKAGNLRGYWRCMERAPGYERGGASGEALERVLTELRLAVAFGLRAPAGRRIGANVQDALTYWIGWVGVATNGPGRFRVAPGGNGRSVPDAASVATHFRAAADLCELDVGALASSPERQRYVQQLASELRSFATILEPRGASDAPSDWSFAGLRDALARFADGRQAPVEPDEKGMVEWASRIVQEAFDKCARELGSIADQRTADAV
jgi:hypothetical protein